MNRRIRKKREKNRINEYAEVLRGKESEPKEIPLEELEAAGLETRLEKPEPKEIEIPLEELEAAEIEEIFLEDHKYKSIDESVMSNKETMTKRNRHPMQNCLLFISLGITMLGMMIYGFAVSWFGQYSFVVELDRPVFVSFLLGEIDEPEVVMDEEPEPESVIELMADNETEVDKEQETDVEVTSEPESEEEEGLVISDKLAEEYLKYYGEQPFTIGDDEITHYVNWDDNKSHSMYYTSPGVRAVSSVYDYKQVDETYFDNSVIIGDSRIEGLHEYSGWENATFLYKRGLTVYAMMDKEVQLDRSRRSTVIQTLSERQFDNVYIMVGINELGGGGDDKFAEKYKENIGIIRELQPDARIIIMSIMFETKEYSDSKPVYNNDNVNAKNVAIAKLANGKDIFYLDVNPSIADPETGVMPESWSFDGVHMKAQYYSYWVDYMYAHGY